jgi:hypothetical protein
MTTMINSIDEIPSDFKLRIEQAYQDFQSGARLASEALDMLCEILAPIEDRIKFLETFDKKARAYASEMVDYLGGSIEVAGFGELKITNPSISYSYDKKSLDRLTNELRTEGLGDVAARMDRCLKPSEKVGSLRITRTKGE